MKPGSICKYCNYNDKGKCKAGIGKAKEFIRDCSEWEEISLESIIKK